MKITIELYDDIVTHDLPDESRLPTVMDACCNLLVCCGYSRENIKEYMEEKVEEIKEK